MTVPKVDGVGMYAIVVWQKENVKEEGEKGRNKHGHNFLNDPILTLPPLRLDFFPKQPIIPVLTAQGVHPWCITKAGYSMLEVAYCQLDSTRVPDDARSRTIHQGLFSDGSLIRRGVFQW